jgi:hypothetical protein
MTTTITRERPDTADARVLHERTGYRTCPPFGDYTESPLNIFFDRKIA